MWGFPINLSMACFSSWFENRRNSLSLISQKRVEVVGHFYAEVQIGMKELAVQCSNIIVTVSLVYSEWYQTQDVLFCSHCDQTWHYTVHHNAACTNTQDALTRTPKQRTQHIEHPS